MPQDGSSPSLALRYGRRAVRQLCIVPLVFAFACSPVRLALPVRGVVVDQETHQPIADATVELTAETQWFAFPEGETRTLQVALTRSGRAGRFTVGGGANVLFPRCIGWKTNVAVFAPGYYGSEWNPVSDSVGFGTPWPLHTLVPVTVALKRLRYLRPLVCDYERHAYAETFRHLSVDEDDNSLPVCGPSPTRQLVRWACSSANPAGTSTGSSSPAG